MKPLTFLCCLVMLFACKKDNEKTDQQPPQINMPDGLLKNLITETTTWHYEYYDDYSLKRITWESSNSTAIWDLVVSGGKLFMYCENIF